MRREIAKAAHAENLMTSLWSRARGERRYDDIVGDKMRHVARERARGREVRHSFSSAWEPGHPRGALSSQQRFHRHCGAVVRNTKAGSKQVGAAGPPVPNARCGDRVTGMSGPRRALAGRIANNRPSPSRVGGRWHRAEGLAAISREIGQTPRPARKVSKIGALDRIGRVENAASTMAKMSAFLPRVASVSRTRRSNAPGRLADIAMTD